MPELDLSRFMPPRSAQDVLSGEVTVTLGHRPHTLPVLAINPNRRWKAGLEGSLRALLDGVDASRNDVGQILALLAGATDKLLDALYSYDTTTVLPPRAQLEDEATEAEVLRAVLAVWVAANPMVGLALSAMLEAEEPPIPEMPTSGSQAPTNSRPRSTAGSPRKSKPS